MNFLDTLQQATARAATLEQFMGPTVGGPMNSFYNFRFVVRRYRGVERYVPSWENIRSVWSVRKYWPNVYALYMSDRGVESPGADCMVPMIRSEGFWDGPGYTILWRDRLWQSSDNWSPWRWRVLDRLSHWRTP